MRDGLIGDVYMARGLCFKWRDTIGRKPVEPVPAGVHYDLWLGPAPKQEFTQNRFHYNWHWFWDYGNGDIGNQGIHQVDVAAGAWGQVSNQSQRHRAATSCLTTIRRHRTPAERHLRIRRQRQEEALVLKCGTG